jgi:hypothetical protein
VTAAGNGNFNSYFYGQNADTLNGTASDSLFVFDGAGGSAFRLAAPAGITSFQGLQQVASMDLLVGLATRRNAGDAGLVVFDLQNQAAKLLPIPAGFASLTIAGIFPTTRKLVARATKPANDGAQLLIYDLIGGGVTVVPQSAGRHPIWTSRSRRHIASDPNLQSEGEYNRRRRDGPKRPATRTSGSTNPLIDCQLRLIA